MAAITICSDFWAPQNKVWHCFPIYFPWSDGTRCHDLFSECWALSQLFHFPLSLSSKGFLVPPHFLIGKCLLNSLLFAYSACTVASISWNGNVLCICDGHSGCTRIYRPPKKSWLYNKYVYWASQGVSCQYRKCRRRVFDSWAGMIPWRRKWQPTPVFLPGEYHGQRNLVGYTVHEIVESDTTEHTCTADY